MSARHATSRHLVALVAGGATSLGAIAPASANGPFLELMGGLDIPAFVETDNETELSAGPTFGAILGSQLTDAFSIELFVQALSEGDRTPPPATSVGGTDLTWSQSAVAFALRYEPIVVAPSLRFEAVGGLGFTFFDLATGDDTRALNAFVVLLGVRQSFDVGWGFYVGTDARLLVTPTGWQDAGAGNKDVDAFQQLPLLLTLTAGYQLDLDDP